ncbi:PTS sugar transporter subunit IIA [Agromyces bauzanensis]|uniref:PTS EIIA type-2 domain-containing protein n=1 Tax=Agromyces bauzanensis TaxID=1308924 RepID=A0A917PR38_9MICO|nr:PTS sugar transporter subunit IIA [Agromyces bauzanensis]GGJ88071.1 hypothetical protein GCM10011372_28230 [Agromyces bauzanensis]
MRAARVIRSLIDAADGLDVYEPAAANHASDSTFEADLARVRARLEGTGLRLVRQGPASPWRDPSRRDGGSSARSSATSRRGACSSSTSCVPRSPRSRASGPPFSRNPLTTSIKAAYPLIYELAVYIASELARSEGIAVIDDEIAYIAVHVGAYLDRRRSRGEVVRVAVSAPAYHDVHTALAERVRAAVDDDVEVVAGDDVGSADLVVAVLAPTAPVGRLVIVSPFPTEDDLERFRAEVSRVRSARRRMRLAASLSRYIAPELFVRGMRGLDREGVIRHLGDRMISSGVIDQAYVEGALERERLSSTAFTEHLAVPHAMTMSARRTAIAIAVDDTPVDWGGAHVHVVALIAFAESGRAEFQEVFDQFVEAFSERENVQRLVQGAEDYPGLLAELARLMEPHGS